MSYVDIRCVGDFLRIIKKIYPENERAYFRGQSNSQYNVNSSFFRLVEDTKKGQGDTYSYILSNKLFKEFKNNMPAYSENNLLKDYSLNDIDLMMVAQHYGLATRLVDWTKSPLVALYFAAERKCTEDYASVYMIFNVPEVHPVTILSSQSFSNSVRAEQRKLLEIRSLIEKNFKNRMTTDLAHEIYIIANSGGGEFINPPIKINEKFVALQISMICLKMAEKEEACHNLFQALDADIINSSCGLSSIKIFNKASYVLEPLPLNPRIKNQQGVFVFSNALDLNLIENRDIPEENIVKSYLDVENVAKNKGIIRVDVPAEHLTSIQDELNLYGISKDFIYPELPSYTETMQKRMVSEVHAGKI